jgi:carbonyl reductase 1
MQRVIITGGNKGIGLSIVEACLRRSPPVFVYLGSRDVALGEAARALLLTKEASWADRLAVLQLDVTSSASVAEAAAALPRDGSLHAICNNAGIAEGSARAIFDVNVFGVARVFDAFAPLFPASGGRVVNLGSGSGPMFVAKCSAARQAFFRDASNTMDTLASAAAEYLAASEAAAGGDGGAALGALGYPPAADFMAPYGASKAFLHSMTRAWSNAHPALGVYAASPGLIKTDLTSSLAPRWGRTLEQMGAKTCDEGALPPSFLLWGEPPQRGAYYGSDCLLSPLHRGREPGSPAWDGTSD